MSMIQVRKLHVDAGGKPILHNIQFHAERGQFIGLIGPNGSGKSTLLRSLAGFIPRRSGDVVLRGKHLSKYRSRELARLIGYVPQNTNVDFAFTAQHIVLMGRHPYKSRFDRENEQDFLISEQAMQATDTQHLADQMITDLSGGQRQMIFIAKALAQQPQILLLDEPISALDIRYQLKVLELVHELTKRGITAIAALHDLNLAARYCNKLILLCNGKILQQGSPDKVINQNSIRKAYEVESHICKDPITLSPSITAYTKQPHPKQLVIPKSLLKGNLSNKG